MFCFSLPLPPPSLKNNPKMTSRHESSVEMKTPTSRKNLNQNIFTSTSASAASVREQLIRNLARTKFPPKLIARIIQDAEGAPFYERVDGVQNIRAIAPNSSYLSSCCLTTCFTCNQGFLVEEGTFGLVKIDSDFCFAAPGWHTVSDFGSEYLGTTKTNIVNKAVTHGPSGFVTITNDRIGVLLVGGGQYRLLFAGTYWWDNSPSVRFEGAVDITQPHAKLGPYSFVTCPGPGICVATLHNGDLKILGWNNEKYNKKHLAALNDVELVHFGVKQNHEPFLMNSPQKEQQGVMNPLQCQQNHQSHTPPIANTTNNNDDDDQNETELQKITSPPAKIITNLQDFQALEAQMTFDDCFHLLNPKSPMKFKAALTKNPNNGHLQSSSASANASFDYGLPVFAETGSSRPQQQLLISALQLQQQQHQAELQRQPDAELENNNNINKSFKVLLMI